MMGPFTIDIVVCLTLASAGAASVFKFSPQRDFCSWGAQYWCSSTQTADLCGKTEWCARNDWPYDVVQDLPCTVTQQLIKNTRKLIINSAQKPLSEHDLAQFIAKGCSLLEDSLARLQCKELVTKEDVLLKLVKLVNSKLSMKSVAAAVGVCKKNIPKDQPCVMCADVVSTAQKYISKFMTEEAYLKLIEPHCAKLGQGHQLCQVIGQAKYKDFYNGLISAQAQSLCHGSTQCYGAATNLQAVQASLTECEACKVVVSEIRQLDRNQNVQATIKGLFKSVCVKLGEFEQLCDNLADKALEYVFELIATEMEPDVVCDELKLCTSSGQKSTQHHSLSNSGAVCTICDYILKGINHAINSNITKEKLEAFLDNICNRLPSPINTECQNFVTQYYSTIIQLLLNNIDPDKVCTALGVCNNETSAPQVNLLPKISSQSNYVQCELCKYAVQYLDKFLEENSTEAEIEALLNKMCALLPGNLNEQCKSLVAQYGPVIIQLLESEMQPELVCTVLKFCPGNKQAPQYIKFQSKFASQPNDEICDMCKFAVTYLDNFLDKNTTEAELEFLLDKVCDILPGNLSVQCRSLVYEYVPLIVQLLQYELQPEQVCVVLQLCTGNKQAAPQVKLQPKISSQSNDVQCELCKYAVQYLDTFLEKNSTEAEIEAVLNKLCAILPESLREQCKILVAAYGPMIIQLLESEMQPEQVCTALKLCPENKQAPPHIKFQSKFVAPPNDQVCSMCEHMEKYFEDSLTENATEAEAEQLLSEMCNALTDDLKELCVFLASRYGTDMIKLVQQKHEAGQVCIQLKLCAGSTQAAPQVKLLPKIISQPNDVQCDMCKYVVSYLDTFLKQNSTEAEIEALLDKVCDILPENLKEECESLVAQYGPQIIQLLVSELQPELVCTVLKLCPGNKQGLSEVAALAHVVTPVLKIGKQKTETCALCEAIMLTLEAKLKEKVIQEEIVSALDKVCDLLPENDKATCIQVLPMYTGYIVDLLDQELPPKLFCKIIKICLNDELSGSELQTPVKKGGACTVCLFVTEVAYEMLASNATKTDIEKILDDVCNRLPTNIKAECLTFVNLYLPYVVDLILQNLPPQQICKKLGLCSATVSQVELSQIVQKNALSSVKSGTQLDQKNALSSVKSEEDCSVCIYVVKVLDTILQMDATQAEIEAALNQVCSYVSTFKDQCEQFVALYTPFVIDFITKEFTPPQICDALALCTNGTRAKFQAPTYIKKAGSGPNCIVCEYIVKYLETLLVKNATVQQVETALEQVCNFVPSTFRPQCNNFITQYTPTLVQLLTTFAPKTVCSHLGLCSSQVKVPPKSLMFVPENEATTSSPQIKEYCSACKFALYEVQSALGDPFWQNKTKEILEGLCNYLQSGQAECLNLVDANIDFVINSVRQFRFPIEFCQLINFCEPPAYTQESCSFCTKLATKVGLYTQQKKTVDEITALVTTTCSTVIPEAMRSQCSSMVKKHTPVLAHLVTQNNDPTTVCQAASLCARSYYGVNKALKSGGAK